MDTSKDRSKSTGGLLLSLLTLAVLYLSISVLGLWDIGTPSRSTLPNDPDATFVFYAGHITGSIVMFVLVAVLAAARILLPSTTPVRPQVELQALVWGTLVSHVVIVLFGAPFFVYDAPAIRTTTTLMMLHRMSCRLQRLMHIELLIDGCRMWHRTLVLAMLLSTMTALSYARATGSAAFWRLISDPGCESSINSNHHNTDTQFNLYYSSSSGGSSSSSYASASDREWIFPVLGALIGTWAGAFPIPLDWDRPWQVRFDGAIATMQGH